MHPTPEKLHVYSLDGLALPFPEAIADQVEVHVQPEINAADLDNLLRTISGRTAIIVRSKTKLTDDHAAIIAQRMAETDLNDASGLSLCLVRAGVDRSSISSAFDTLGVPVHTTPTTNRISTANCAVRALQFLSNSDLQERPDTLENRGRRQYNEGGHDKLLWSENAHRALYSDAPINGTVGFIGAGPIALRAAAQAQALGAKVLFWNRTQNKPELRDYQVVAHVNDLAEQCDAISLHLPGVSGTKNIVNAEFWARVPDNTRMKVVNFGRGSLMDEKAFLAALKADNGRIGRCVLDVLTIEGKTLMQPLSHYEVEHPDIAHITDVLYPILRDPRVYPTFHSGPETTTNKEQNGAEAVQRIIEQFDLLGS